MKFKVILSLILLVIPLMMAPAGSVAEVTTSGDSSFANFSTVTTETGSYEMLNADDAYLTEWRDLVSNLKQPQFDYTISHPEFSANEAGDFFTSLSDSDTGFTEARPCDTCLKDSRPIEIDGEKELRRQDGSGTVDDPYVIDYLAISGDRSNLIQIQNTVSHIVISNNFLFGEASGFSAIVLNNVEHVTIQANNLTNNGIGIIISNSNDITIVGNRVDNFLGDSITVTSSTNVNIVDNTVWNNGLGIVVDSTTGGSISGNTVFDNGGTGITLSYSTGFTISANTVYQNAADGIFFQDSDNNSITGNTVYSNGFGSGTSTNDLGLLSFENGKFVLDASFGGAGIWLDPSFNNDVSQNNVYDNAGMGVFLEFSGDSTIDSNTIANNGLAGIFFLDSNDNAITNNQISGNGNSPTLASMLNGLSPMDYFLAASFGGAGIWLDPSYRNVISGNVISSNVGEGIILEYSDYTTIDSNTVTDNGLNGIMFIDTDDSSITNNQVANNGAGAAAIIANSVMSTLEAKLFASFGGAGIWLDPSHRNTVDNNVVSNNVGSGVFFWESTTSTISNNQILSNGQEGILFLNSSSNEIVSNLVDSNGYSAATSILNSITVDDMKLFASFGGAGIWLDPSPNNVLDGNIITNSAGSGIYFLDTNHSIINENTIANSGAAGIFFQDSSHNAITNNRVSDSGATISAVAARLDASFGGAGIWLDPSHFNDVVANNVSRSTGDGVFSEGSTNSFIADNRIHDNVGYGLYFDDASAASFAQDNNFVGNDGTGAQGRDDGIDNGVASNFWSDADNNDTNFDGISDKPYLLDGDAGTADTQPSNIPEGLNFYTAESESSPRKLNAESEGSPLTIKVYLADGYRALSIDLNKVWLNGTIQPFNYHIIDIQTFTVTFERAQVNALVNSLGLTPEYYVTFETVLLMNDGLLEVTAYDDVLVHQDADETLILVAGITGMMALPATIGKKKEGKVSSFLTKLRNKFN